MYPLRDPRGQEMRLSPSSSIRSVYTYICKRITFTFTRATPRDIRAYTLARLGARSGNAVGLSPAEGIRYDDDGDNLRLYPGAGQRFN